MSEEYTITQRDVDGCRTILDQLKAFKARTGEYTVGSIQGHAGSAQGTVRFERKPGPMVTAEVMATMLDAAPRLALVCKKVVAHVETHGLIEASDA